LRSNFCCGEPDENLTALHPLALFDEYFAYNSSFSMLHRLPLTGDSQTALRVGSRVHPRKSRPAKKSYEEDECDSNAKADLPLRAVEVGLLNSMGCTMDGWNVSAGDSN
jgi:hypothetical protein